MQSIVLFPREKSSSLQLQQPPVNWFPPADMPLLLMFLVLFLKSAYANHNIWSTTNGNPIDTGLRRISLSVVQDINSSSTTNLTKICLMDKLSFAWKISEDSKVHDTLNMDDVSIAVVDSTGSRMFLVPLGIATTIVAVGNPELISSDRPHSIISEYSIQCEIPSDNCIPAIRTVISFADRGKLSITFDQPTNMPSLESTFAVRSALDITPRIIGGAIGEWTSADTLELAVSQQYITVLNNAYLNGEVVSISSRKGNSVGSELQFDPSASESNGNHRSGVVKIRFREHGLLTVAAVDRNSMHMLSSYCIIKISPCDEDVNILPLFVQSDNLTYHSEPGRSSTNRFESGGGGRAFYMKGVFAVSGTTPVVVAHESIPAMEKGIWSVSCWFRLLQAPTGSFRTLFFKGDRLGRDAQRTPSVWLLPDRNRFTVRVSTSSTPDMGAETTLDIPLHDWTFLTFVFQNNSGTLSYSTSVYVNGVLDVRIQYGEPVAVNSGPLQFFKDVSHSGPRAMVQDLCVWDRALGESDVLALYNKGFLQTGQSMGRKAVSAVVTVERALQVLTESSSSLIATPPRTTPVVKKRAIAENIESLLQEDDKFDGEFDRLVTKGSELDMADDDEFAVYSRSNRLLQSVELIQKWKDNGGEGDCSESGWRQRLDLFAEAAILGNAEALLYWAMLRIFGYTHPQSSCGASMVRVLPHDEVDEDANTIALIFAVDMGESRALEPLALRLLTGVGTRSLWAQQSDDSTSRAIRILPLPREYKSSTFHDRLRHAVRQSFGKAKALAAARSALDYITYSTLPSGSQTCPMTSVLVDDHEDLTVTDLALGFLHVAAMFADSEAAAILANKYQHGLMLEKDTETAAQYASIAAEVASTEFHRVGGQPVLESDRINDDTAPQVATGNKGDQDELIQHQIVRAKEGDVGAMLAMGDLFYYGARGMPRDQAQALQYFQQAASVGSAEGLCGAAGMLLKGEGTPGNQPNVTAAVQLYEEAAAQGSLRALNGLGYIYFYGQGLEKNSSRAFEYFLQAAEAQPSDGDALFNTAVCLHHGIGVETNLERAVGYYKVAAQKFGHFGSVKAMGTVLLEGQGVIARNSEAALPYLNAAVQIGPWVGWLRRGLDLYLTGQFRRSANCYLHAGEIGYEVSVSNAAYVLKNKISRRSHPSPNPLAKSNSGKQSESAEVVIDTDGFLLLRELLLSASQGNADSMVELGHCYLTGATSCGVGMDIDLAISWYSKAGIHGQPIASIYMGFIHHFGLGVEVNIPRAERYYASALQNANLKSAYVRMAVRSLLYLLPYAESYAAMPLNTAIKYFMKSSFL